MTRGTHDLACGVAGAVQQPDRGGQQKRARPVVCDGIRQGQKQPDVQDAERHLGKQDDAQQDTLTGETGQDWFAADAGDVFSDEPDELWRTVLRRQPGRLAWFSDAPDDLSSN